MDVTGSSAAATARAMQDAQYGLLRTALNQAASVTSELLQSLPVEQGGARDGSGAQLDAYA